MLNGKVEGVAGESVRGRDVRADAAWELRARRAPRGGSHGGHGRSAAMGETSRPWVELRWPLAPVDGIGPWRLEEGARGWLGGVCEEVVFVLPLLREPLRGMVVYLSVSAGGEGWVGVTPATRLNVRGASGGRCRVVMVGESVGEVDALTMREILAFEEGVLGWRRWVPGPGLVDEDVLATAAGGCPFAWREVIAELASLLRSAVLMGGVRAHAA
mgnify:CR=1 FL=1